MKVLNVFFFLTPASSVSARLGSEGGHGGMEEQPQMNSPPVQPPNPGSRMATAAHKATGTVPHRSAGKMSPSQQSRMLAASQELLFNQLPLPQTTYSRDSHHHHHPPLHRCPGAGTTTGHPGGRSGAGQEPAGSRDPSDELPGAAGDAVSPQRCPAPGLDEPPWAWGGLLS